MQSKKVAVFKEILDTFETEEMRDYCIDMIDKMEDYIFQIPASTTMKYHNATQCQKHGQIIHVIMLVKILNYRLNLDWNIAKYDTPKKRDALRCAGVFHDALKCGRNGSQYTLFKHPLMAGEWVRFNKVVNDIDQDTKDLIADMCERHSGQYNTSSRDKTVLPTPDTEEQFLIHECDVLASRADIDMTLSEDLKAALADLDEDVSECVISFGKYKGALLVDVFEKDVQYVKWLATTDLKEPLLSAVQELL